MSAITRREFLQKTATDAALAGFFAAGATRAFASPLGLPIGSQTYPHRQMVMEGNFAGLCKMMAEIGVQSLELCSPGYKEFASLADAKQVRKILDDHRLAGLLRPGMSAEPTVDTKATVLAGREAEKRLASDAAFVRRNGS